jgi:hypothetical protein
MSYEPKRGDALGISVEDQPHDLAFIELRALDDAGAFRPVPRRWSPWR